MEVNRYLIAALYVMAGCAVTVPLKAKATGGAIERCRLTMTQTVRTITVPVEQTEREQMRYSLPDQCEPIPTLKDFRVFFSFLCSLQIERGSLCRTSHKIRAPEC